MSQRSISALSNFYHANHKDGKYNVRYNNINLGLIDIYFHYQSDKWVVVLSDISVDVDEKVFDTNGKISYNKSQNILTINQYGVNLEIYP